MSKIINKKQLDFLIESTMKEASIHDPGEYYDYVDWTKHPEGIHNLDTASQALASTTYGEKGGKPNNPNEPSEEDIKSATEYIQYMKDGMCECGAMMYEGICEAGCGSQMEEGSYMKEDELEEGDAFGKAVSDAKKAGKTEFKFQGKTYPVKESDSVEESVKDLAESVTKTFNPSFLTEEIDNFKKLINYRNK